jgi:hypothetical protein
MVSSHVPGHPVALARTEDHPKDQLYRLVYDPITLAWFDAFARSKAVPEVIASARPGELLSSLEQLNTVCHDLVDEAMRDLGDAVAPMARLIGQHRAWVHWVGYMVPANDATVADLVDSLSHKIKRNISLGIVEFLICLESAYVFARDDLRLDEPTILRTLSRSRRLYSVLAAAHDEQERTRFEFLAGIDGYLTYPQVDFPDVLGGKIRIPADRFVASRQGERWSLHYVDIPEPTEPLNGPVKMCPAQRFRNPVQNSRTLNDMIWGVLLDLYEACGRFTPAAGR